MRITIRHDARPSQQCCGVAQLVERRIVNPVVGGSSPPATANFFKNLARWNAAHFVSATHSATQSSGSILGDHVRTLAQVA